jgi:hypothetical protein
MFTIVVCLIFGLVALTYARKAPSLIALPPEERVAFRMSLCVSATAALSLVLMLLGTHWLAAVILAFVIVLLFQGKLVQLTERSDK